MSRVANFLGYQLGWLACVCGAAQGRPWLGAAVGLALVLLHLARAPQWRAELRLVLLAAVIGAVFDTLLARGGWVHYAGGALLERTAPAWILVLWMLFATTVRHSLAALGTRPALASALGAVGAPLAYLGGARLGALTLPQPILALGALAVGWATVCPLLFRVGPHA